MSRQRAHSPRLPRDLGWILAIGVLGLSLRLAYSLEFASHPVGRVPWTDEGAYWSRAREIRAGHWLPSRPFYQDPLLPYALAAMSSVVGPDVPRLRVVLSCLGALTPLAIFWAGRRGLGRTEGIVAGLAAALHGPLIFTDGLIEKEGLGAMVAALALALTAEMTRRSPRLIASGVTGTAWGVLALLRSNALVIAPLGAAWLASLGEREGSATGPRRGAARALAFLIGFGIPLAPVTIVNAVVGRPPELLMTTWQMGANFYIGNGPEATGTYTAPAFVEPNPAREASDFAAEARRRAGRELTPGQVSRFWLAEGLKRWRDAPGDSVVLLARKVGLLAHNFEIPDNQDPEFIRVVAAPALALGVVSFGWVAPWAAVGLGRTPRTRFWWWLVLSSAAGLGSTAIFFVVGRYRIPWTPGLLLLGASGAVDVARRVRERRWRSLAWRVALLMVPAAILAWRPLSDPSPDRWGHAMITLALADLAAGQLEPAIDALDDARALGPGPARRIQELLSAGPGRDLMGALIAARPRAERRSGAGLDSDLRRARWMRQFSEGQAESRDILARILRANPHESRALRERGAWWLGLIDDPEARHLAAEDFALAVSEPGGDPSAAVLLALLVNDPKFLPKQAEAAPRVSGERLRMVRAILRARAP